jgi:Zn-dependent peptidase ImmA (M78 family)
MLYEMLEKVEQGTDFGFNKRPLGYGDFKRICKKNHICAKEKPLLSELKGIFTWYGENPHVCVNSRLPERERTYVAFCELGHFLFHDKTNHFFTKMQDKCELGEIEYQTHVFASLCVVPTSDLVEMFNRRRGQGKPMNFRYLCELAELYNTTFPIIDSRLRIFYDYIFAHPDVLGRGAWPV